MSGSPVPPPATPDLPTSGVGLKEHIEAYESARRMVHWAFLITGVVSFALLGMARNPKLALDELVPWLGAKVKASGGTIPVASYAVVLGLIAIPVLMHWCYKTLTVALGLRQCVSQFIKEPTAESERLRWPFWGSDVMRQRSLVARWESAFTLLIAGAGPIICSVFLLADYSHKFKFDLTGNLKRYNEPFALWHTASGDDVVRPQTFDSVQNDYHPALLPIFQPWLYLVLLCWASWLMWDAYRQLGVWEGIRRFAKARFEKPTPKPAVGGQPPKINPPRKK
jgi:hypothetical protein